MNTKIDLAIIDKCYSVSSGFYYVLKYEAPDKYGMIGCYNSVSQFYEDSNVEYCSMPKIVMADILLPDNGFEDIAKTVLKFDPTTCVIALYDEGQETELHEALKHGATGVYNKNQDCYALLGALKEAQNIGLLFSDKLTEEGCSQIIKNRHRQLVFNNFEPGEPDYFPLNQKEYLGVILYSLGYETHAKYRRKAQSKMKVKSDAQLMLKAMENKWIYTGKRIAVEDI